MKIGKKSKTLLAFALFLGFALTDINLHDFIGLYLVGIILAGLGIWLRKWRDRLEFYHRLKRAIHTIGFLTMIVGIFWLAHVLDNIWFGFMVSILIALSGLFLYTKKRYHIVEFEDLSEQQKRHNGFVRRNYSFLPYKWYVDWVLRKPKYASARNRLAEAEAWEEAVKGRKMIWFERLWPLIFFVGLALFMLMPR